MCFRVSCDRIALNIYELLHWRRARTVNVKGRIAAWWRCCAHLEEIFHRSWWNSSQSTRRPHIREPTQHHSTGLTASATVSDASAPAYTNGVWPLLRIVSVAQRSRPLTMLSSNVQSINLPMDRMAWRFWMTKQSNSCSTPASRSTVVCGLAVDKNSLKRWRKRTIRHEVWSRTAARKSSLVGVCVCKGVDFKKWQNLHWLIVFHISIWGAWSFVWGLSPPNHPWRWDRFSRVNSRGCQSFSVKRRCSTIVIGN